MYTFLYYTLFIQFQFLDDSNYQVNINFHLRYTTKLYP